MNLHDLSITIQLALFAAFVVFVWEAIKAKRKEIEAWKRAAELAKPRALLEQHCPKANIRKIGTLVLQGYTPEGWPSLWTDGWEFEIINPRTIPSSHSPVFGQISYGYTAGELLEIYQRRKEFCDDTGRAC